MGSKERPVVVVGFDDSPAAVGAVRWAALEARARDARLRVVTAWDPPPVSPWNLSYLVEWRHEASEEAKEGGRLATSAVGGALPVDTLAIEGAPGAVLTRESRLADLLVIGSRGHIGLAGLLAGGVSRHCLSEAYSPVVVLGPNSHQEATERLVLSSTLDPDGECIPGVARWLAARRLPVHVIGSFEISASVADLALPPAYDGVRAAVEQANARWIARLHDALDGEAGPAEITGAVLEGSTRDVLADQTGPGDLLVVPTGCEHSIPIAHGTCPIAVLPAGQWRRDRVPAARSATIEVRPAHAEAGAW